MPNQYEKWMKVCEKTHVITIPASRNLIGTVPPTTATNDDESSYYLGSARLQTNKQELSFIFSILRTTDLNLSLVHSKLEGNG
jgi:hypothetical protein